MRGHDYPYLILYHSRSAIPARLAAALHLGLLPPEAPAQQRELQLSFAQLGGGAMFRAEGLWPAGVDAEGRHVFAFGRASRPDVVRRAFHRLAEMHGIDGREYLLQNVGHPVAWADMGVGLLRLVSLHGVAYRLSLRAMRAGWAEALDAVRRVKERQKGGK